MFTRLCVKPVATANLAFAVIGMYICVYLFNGDIKNIEIQF